MPPLKRGNVALSSLSFKAVRNNPSYHRFWFLVKEYLCLMLNLSDCTHVLICVCFFRFVVVVVVCFVRVWVLCIVLYKLINSKKFKVLDLKALFVDMRLNASWKEHTTARETGQTEVLKTQSGLPLFSLPSSFFTTSPGGRSAWNG